MDELYLAFLRTPTSDTFRAVREAVLRDAKYNGYSHDLDRMCAAHEAGQYPAVRAAFSETYPNLLLSPKAHLLLSLAFDHAGNADVAETEGWVYARCIAGILGTGDGTEEKPYLVLRTSDEYDVLQALGKQTQGQALVQGPDGRAYDQMHLADGSQAWFDITDLYNVALRRIEDAMAAGRPPG